MKIAIATTQVPFIYGGAEFLVEVLRKKLIEAGHEACVIKLPFFWNPNHRILESLMIAKLTRTPNVDMLLGMKFPAYCINHPNKRMWLMHQYRQAYDLGGTEYDPFTQSAEDQEIKRAVHKADERSLKNVQGTFFTISPLVTERLKKFNGIDSVPLCSPLIDEELYHPGDFGDYLFFPSRVNASKRQWLAVEALRYVKSDVKLVLAGCGDSKQDEERIIKLIEKHNLKSKVTYLNRFISQEEKAELYSKSLGSVYVPYHEDSYGYITLEAMYSGKPVISTTDAGGTSLLVKDGETGYMTEPQPQAIAEAMDKLYNNKATARSMGANGLPLINQRGYTWANTIRRLLA